MDTVFKIDSCDIVSEKMQCVECTVMRCRRLLQLLSWRPSAAIVILISFVSIATVVDAYYEKTCTREDRLRPRGVCGRKLTFLISTLCQSQYNKRNAAGKPNRNILPHPTPLGAVPGQKTRLVCINWSRPTFHTLIMGGVSLLGLGANAVGSGEEALLRPEGPRAGGRGRVLGRGQSDPSPSARGFGGAL